MRSVLLVCLLIGVVLAEKKIFKKYEKLKKRLGSVTCLNDVTKQSCYQNVNDVAEGHDISLICMNGLDVKPWCNMARYDRPMFNVTWYKDGNLVDLSESCSIEDCYGYILELDGRSLVLTNVTDEMNGTYECHVAWYDNCCDPALTLDMCQPKFRRVGRFHVTIEPTGDSNFDWESSFRAQSSSLGQWPDNTYPWHTRYIFFAELKTAAYIKTSGLDARNFKSVYDWRQPEADSHIWSWKERGPITRGLLKQGDTLIQHKIVHEGDSLIADCYLDAANPAVDIEWVFFRRTRESAPFQKAEAYRRRWSIYVPKLSRIHTRTKLVCTLKNGIETEWNDCRTDVRMRRKPLCWEPSVSTYEENIELVDSDRRNWLSWNNSWQAQPIEDVILYTSEMHFNLCVEISAQQSWGRIVASNYFMVEYDSPCRPTCPEIAWEFRKGWLINSKDPSNYWKRCDRLLSAYTREDDIYVWRIYYAQWPTQVQYVRQRIVYAETAERPSLPAPTTRKTLLPAVLEGTEVTGGMEESSEAKQVEERSEVNEESSIVLPVTLAALFVVIIMTGALFVVFRQRCIGRRVATKTVFMTLKKTSLTRSCTEASDSGIVSSDYMMIPEIRIVSNNEFYISMVDECDYIIPKDTWEIPRDRVVTGELLGQGAFGTVYSGTLCSPSGNTSMTVAIKMSKGQLTDDDMKDLLGEMMMLKYISKEKGHAHVIRMYGCCTQEAPLILVLEMARCGDLRSFLHGNYPHSPTSYLKQEPGQVTQLQRRFTNFAHQICLGMLYLVNLKVVHRDLAARNVLVADGLVLKIADFGMTRQLRPDYDYYRPVGHARVPVKWMPPEAINFGRFTNMSDVWAYGVVIWEIFSLGSSPYPTHRLTELAQSLELGYRLPAPALAPKEMCDLMTECWQFAANQRPTFEMIEEHILASATFTDIELPIWEAQTLEELERTDTSCQESGSQLISSI